jgi:hypothetical protein
MAKTRRRGGGASIGDYFRKLIPANYGKSVDEIAADRKKAECAKKREDLDKECSPGESVAPQTNEVAQNAAEASGAPSATPSTGQEGRARRRRQTRRKTYKGGKHRKGHRA